MSAVRTIRRAISRPNMTENQAEQIVKELRIIRNCCMIFTIIVTLAAAKATFQL